MAILETKIQNKIDELSNESYEYYSKGDKETSYKLMEDAWNHYPEPKENWNESFNTTRYALEDLLNDGELNKAKIWIKRMEKVQSNLKLWDGIFQFYMGKYSYEIGDLENALKFFEEAITIGKGYRYFEDQNPKYLKFVKERS